MKEKTVSIGIVKYQNVLIWIVAMELKEVKEVPNSDLT